MKSVKGQTRRWKRWKFQLVWSPWLTGSYRTCFTNLPANFFKIKINLLNLIIQFSLSIVLLKYVKKNYRLNEIREGTNEEMKKKEVSTHGIRGWQVVMHVLFYLFFSFYFCSCYLHGWSLTDFFKKIFYLFVSFYSCASYMVNFSADFSSLVQWFASLSWFIFSFSCYNFIGVCFDICILIRNLCECLFEFWFFGMILLDMFPLVFNLKCLIFYSIFVFLFILFVLLILFLPIVIIMWEANHWTNRTPLRLQIKSLTHKNHTRKTRINKANNVKKKKSKFKKNNMHTKNTSNSILNGTVLSKNITNNQNSNNQKHHKQLKFKQTKTSQTIKIQTNKNITNNQNSNKQWQKIRFSKLI